EENLLFKEADFRDPAKSKLWPELFNLPDPHFQNLAGHLLDASLRPLSEVPLLWDLLDGENILPLSREKVSRLQTALPSVRLPHPGSAPVRADALDWLPPSTGQQPGSQRKPARQETPPALVPAPVPPMPVTVVQPLEPEIVVVPPMPISRIM